MDKKWWQSKTMWLGILVCLLGFLEQLQQVPNLPPPPVFWWWLVF